MNKSLRQLFTIVVALFVILGMSTTIIMAIRANQLTNDARNVRALYHEYGAPRGPFSPRTDRSSQNPILPTIRSRTSVPIPPANCMRRSPDSSPSASVAGAVSKRPAARCCRASRSSCSGSGSSRCSPGRRTRAPISKRPSIRRFSRPHTTASAARMAPQWPSSRKPAVSSPWSARPATTRTSWPAMT